VETVNTYVSVLKDNCVPPFLFLQKYCIQFSENTVVFEPKNTVKFDHSVRYEKITGRMPPHRELRIPVFRFSINKMVFQAIFDTGSDINIISKETASIIGKEDEFDDDVTLQGVGTLHSKVYVRDAEEVHDLSVRNVISAIDYLKKGWSFTLCDDGAGFHKRKNE
jgi:hypothetical protein